MAGKVWIKGFLKRHSELSIRKPEATLAVHTIRFNKIAVGHFYQLLVGTYDALHLNNCK